MRAGRPAVMPAAQPSEVRRRLNPRTHVGRVRDAGVVDLKSGEGDAVLQAELDMRVVKF